MKTNPNAPASPVVSKEGIPTSIDYLDSDPFEKATGLTKREYFAAMAMQGILSTDPKVYSKTLTEHNLLIAEMAVEYADVLIQELNK